MVPTFLLGVPIEPPLGQRCKGRNYGERRCCSPENPCDEGEGDCDGPGDGVPNDGNRGCKPGRKKEETFLTLMVQGGTMCPHLFQKAISP